MSMVKRFEAVYEHGIIRPLQPLNGLTDLTQLTLSIERAQAPTGDWRSCIGTLPDEDARRMREIVADEFSRIDADAW